MDVTGDRSKVQCCKEQYCMEYWTMHECQVHESRQIGSGQTRDDIDILGISELKWTGMVNLTQMTIISTTAGRNPSEEME